MADDDFVQLVHRVGSFHLTDRTMLRAQRAIEASIASGEVAERERKAYLDVALKYFAGFEREARTHLRDVDRRLEAQNQIVFNLTAERGVAVKRIEATQSVLTDLHAFEGAPT